MTRKNNELEAVNNNSSIKNTRNKVVDNTEWYLGIYLNGKSKTKHVWKEKKKFGDAKYKRFSGQWEANENFTMAWLEILTMSNAKY